MSHEVETMAYANAVPWHGLGTRVDPSISTEEMLIAAGLNWRVDMWPMFAENSETGDRVPVSDRFALIRDSDRKLMTIASKRWNPVQNADIIGFFDDYVRAGGATLETAGSLRGGKIIWGLASLDHEFSVTPGDRVKGYLLLSGSHEVGRATTCRTTMVRVVCANTMGMAERRGGVIYRQNHLSVFDEAAAKEAVAAAHADLAEAERRAKIIQKLRLNAFDAMRFVYVPTLFPEAANDPAMLATILEKAAEGDMPKVLSELMDSYRNAPGADQGTGWGALNGFTHWSDHVAGTSQSARLANAWFGANGRAKTEIEERLFRLAA